MKPPEGFSDMGIALTENAIEQSKRIIAGAVVNIGVEIAALRRRFPRLKTKETGGSWANPDKAPRIGIFPRAMRYDEALWHDLLKSIQRSLPPSDVDVILGYPPGDIEAHRKIYQALMEVAGNIFAKTGILIHPVKKNPDPHPAVSARELLDRLNGK